MKWKKNRYLCLTLLTTISIIYACEKETIKPIKIETVSYKTDIAPIFANKCAQCHNGSRNPNLSSAVAAYNSLKSGGYYNITAPADSKIYIKLSDKSSSHVGRASDVQIQEILLWITLGAKND